MTKEALDALPVGSIVTWRHLVWRPGPTDLGHYEPGERCVSIKRSRNVWAATGVVAVPKITSAELLANMAPEQELRVIHIDE